MPVLLSSTEDMPPHSREHRSWLNPVKKPKVGKNYIFVPKHGLTFEHTDYVRYEDGSSGFVVDGCVTTAHGPNGWQGVLIALAELGFVELNEARLSGFVPPGWEPTPETSTAFVPNNGRTPLRGS